MITPIRGRKRIEDACYCNIFLQIRNDNPDKGTETILAPYGCVFFWRRLEMITPIRGRKPKGFLKSSITSILRLEMITPIRGRKPWLWQPLIYQPWLEMITPIRGRKPSGDGDLDKGKDYWLEMITPIRGRKPRTPLSRWIFLSPIRNDNPDKGTETVCITLEATTSSD